MYNPYAAIPRNGHLIKWDEPIKGGTIRIECQCGMVALLETRIAAEKTIQWHRENYADEAFRFKES